MSHANIINKKNSKKTFKSIFFTIIKFITNSFIMYTAWCAVTVAVIRADNLPIDLILSPDYNIDTIKIIDEKKFLNCSIIFICDDKNGKPDFFLIKKTRRTDPKLIVKEIVGAWIAYEIGLPANSVRVIPIQGPLAAKLQLKHTATVHTLVSGIPISKTSSAKEFDIRLSPRNGLDRSIINNMSLHNDLPSIAALDTFTGNSDRNKSNLFYDNELNKFFAIDFGDILRTNLAYPSCIVITKLINEKKSKLSQQKINGLMIYRDTLKQLIDTITPEQILQKIIETSSSIAELKNSDFVTMHTVFSQSYIDCKKLVELLDELLIEQT